MARLEALKTEIERLNRVIENYQKEIAKLSEAGEKAEKEIRSLRAQLNRFKNREE